jgi:outer membrane protein
MNSTLQPLSRHNRALISTLLFVFIPLFLPAQTTFNTLEEVWKYADAHNVTIGNAALELQKAKRGRQQSVMDFLPDVNATGGFTDNTTIQTTLIPAVIFGGPEGVYRPVQFGQKYIYNAGFTAQLDLVNLQTWHNARIAKETEELNKAALGNIKKNTYQQIATLYYACLLNQEALVLAKQSADVADSVFNSVNNKFAEGNVGLPSLDIAKLNSERAQQTYMTASFQLATSQNSLKALLGMNGTDSLNISQPLKLGDETVADAPFTEDPAISLAFHQSKMNLGKLKASNAGAYPILSVLYSNNTQQYDNTFRPFDAGAPQWFPATYWSLRASWGIFNGGNRWLQSQKNKLSYLQSQADLEQSKRQSAINDENIRLSYLKAKALLGKAQSIMNLSYDNYRHTTLRYEEGIASLDDRLRAFSDYINYQNQYLNSLSEMLVQMYNVKIRQQTF